MIKKLISGGQTGADLAGLDAAIELGIPYGGTLPRGRKTENGTLPVKYVGMTEHPSPSYPPRTRENVKNSDCSIVFIDGQMTRGCGLTVNLCRNNLKPYMILDISKDITIGNQGLRIKKWLAFLHKELKKELVINIAGTRESKSPGIHDVVKSILVSAFKNEA